jgi:hypothetical protein
MTERAISALYTRALLDKLEELLADACGMDVRMFAAEAHRMGIGLVDLDRQRCLIDERVYESALHRGRVGAAFLDHRQPSAEVWATICDDQRNDP